MVKYQKRDTTTFLFDNFLEIFIPIQGVQGAIWESPKPIPYLKNHQIYRFFKKFKNRCKNWFDPINGDDFLRWFSLCPLEFHIFETIDFYRIFKKIWKLEKIVFLIEGVNISSIDGRVSPRESHLASIILSPHMIPGGPQGRWAPPRVTGRE